MEHQPCLLRLSTSLSNVRPLKCIWPRQFQNMIYESEHFPVDLKKRIYEWLKVNVASEAKKDETEEQFLYKTRKKALGPFKKEIMGLPQQTRDAIAAEIETKFDFLFKQLNVVNKRALVNKYCTHE